jgi:hypothetical protein
MTKKRIDDTSPRCEHCPHSKDQHDEDGFCEVDDGVLGACHCHGFEAKEVEGTERDT